MCPLRAAPARLAPHLPLPLTPYVPAPGRARPELPISQALAADGAAEQGFSPTLFAYGVDAFHAGCCWEAHECWEVLWRREPRGAPRRDLLQALILLAAARVKSAQGRPRGAAGLHRRAMERLEQVAQGADAGLGIDAPALLRAAQAAGPAGALTMAVRVPPPR